MDEEPRSINSPVLERDSFKQQLEALGKVIDEAQKRIDYTIAHDQDILNAIEVVERFLRKKRRVCYGGQAINSLLPAKYKFYDPKYTIPDYDFFTPNSRADSDELMEMLQKEGFTEVSKKVGMHEGTMKVYVNYVPVADCSDIHPDLFKIVQERAKVVNGILFADPDYLRMMMYLELSRPRGEVDRWKKVYERLTLLNTFYPPGQCEERIRVSQEITWQDRHLILDFIVNNKRLLAGPETIDLMMRNQGKISLDGLVQKGGPVIFLTKQAETDAEDLKHILSEEGRGIKVESFKVESDALFPFCTLRRGTKRIAILFQEEACHAYTTLRLAGTGGQEMRKGFRSSHPPGEFKSDNLNHLEIRIGTPDLLLHLYYSLLIFGKKEKTFFQTSLQCLVDKLHTIAGRSRSHPTGFLPAFGLRCSGHQKGIATLLKEKQARTVEEKKAAKEKGKNTGKNKTRKAK